MLSRIKSFHTQRFCTTRFGDSMSNFKKSETGLPQGIVINPLLLNTFIGDLPGISSFNGLTNAACFEDDLVVWFCAFKEEHFELNTVLN
ncbi:putative RNA-directed DNA polymerase from transposon X-element [Trichonephila clavata]|uniref:Putative RNA-directed DNA polymerase from transposon X-element n=1 Tax=Trichonephila clavata TaxID=2740835 RepID=A0A8X6LQS3_TRICU|nr:putative RNA-directed DNA polymerase from transposon X-element [Trichonephila clavata]